MNNNFISSEEEIKRLIERKIAAILDVNYCYNFNEYVSSVYAWYPTRINWEKSNVTFSKLSWPESSVESINQLLNDSCIGSFQEICVIYSANQPGLIIKSAELYKHIHDISCSVGLKSGIHFYVGCTRDSFNLPVLHNEHFIEVDHRYMIAPILGANVKQP